GIMSSIALAMGSVEIAKLKDNDVATPEAAIQTLMEGNARFFGGQARRPDIGANERRAQILE
ncbi:hypothetical protein, partial [Serratia marcescens]|uniref:hypothetical protein n=1 Tax=Serratia marcescens TaxID=615 RepID=UPI001952E6E1